MTDFQKKPIIKGIFNIFTNRMFFTTLYLITAVFWSFPFFIDFLSYPMKLLFIWGIALIGYDILTSKKCFSGYKSVLLVLLSLFYVITIVTNLDQVYSGTKHLIYNSILLFLIYPYDLDKSFGDYKKWFVKVTDIIIFTVCAASVISIVMFAFHFEYHLVRGNMTYLQGFVVNRLNGVYTSANTGAFFSILTIAFTVVIYALDKAHFRRFMWAYIVNIIVQFLYYSVTLSRGGRLAFICALAAAALVFAYPFFIKHTKKIVAALLSAVCLVASVAVLQVATVTSRNLMLKLPKTVSIVKNFNKPEPEPIEDTVLEREDADGEVTNGRRDIWSAGLALMRKNPIFGVSEANVYSGDTLIADIDESTLTEQNIKELKRVRGYLHNAYVQIIVFSGIIGIAVFAVFAVLAAIRYLKALVRLHGTQYYIPLAAVFLILVIFVSQTFAEGHILYVRQDPYAIMFWLYLGFGMYIITAGKRESADTDLFICATPYQEFNAINISAQIAKEKKADVFVYGTFSSAAKATENLRKTDLFNNVVYIKPYKEYSGTKQKLVTFARLLFPKQTLKAYASGKLPDTAYSKIFLCNYFPFMDSVKLLNPQAEFCEYEDGLRNYYEYDVEKIMRSKLFTFINKYILNGKLSYNAETIYLNHPEFYKGTAFKNVEKIVKSEKVKNDIFTVFDYVPNTQYADGKILYLTQPLSETEAGDASRSVEQKILSAIDNDILIRVHPRQSREEYAGYKQDEYNNLWELECEEQITDDNILIGAYSTALFTPKMLSDKEPTVIFTYKLYGDYYNDFSKTVEMLRSIYKNSNKIIIAESIDDLKNILSENNK